MVLISCVCLDAHLEYITVNTGSVTAYHSHPRWLRLGFHNPAGAGDD